MSGERKTKLHTFLDAVVANGAGTALDVSDFDEIMVFVGAPAAATATIKCRGSIAASDLSAANWAAAASNVVQHDGVLMQSIEDGTTLVEGDTGIALAAASHNKLYSLNVSLLRQLNFVVSGWSAGAISVLAYGVRKVR